MTWAEDDDDDADVRGLRLRRGHGRQLWRVVRPHARLFAVAVAILLLLVGLDAVGPWVLRRTIDGPITQALSGQPTSFADWSPWLLGYAAIFAAALGLGYAQILLMTRAGQRVVHSLRTRLFDHVLHLSPDFFDRTQSGRLVTRISSDCENLSELFTTGIVSTLVDLLKILALLGACFLVSPRLAWLVCLSAPVVAIVVLLFRTRAERGYRDVRGQIARTTGWFAEGMQGVRVTKLFGQEAQVFARFADLNGQTRQGWMQTLVAFGLFFAAVEVVTGATQAVLLLPASHDIPEGRLSYGAFFQFWTYLGLMLGPIRELGDKYNVIQSAFASADRVFTILEEKPSLVEAAAPVQPVPGAVDVRFEQVDFSYKAGVPVLHDVSFEVPRGAHVAVVGPTGAGKTTIIQLLARFRDPVRGRVLVGGVDVRELDLRAHRRRVGIVLQDVFLFASDILENVRLWEETIGEERVARALATVQAQDLVARAGGLRAKVEERGATLSQGERQLLAFARALVHDPAILVLDEATANIDTPTEAKIREAMQVLMRGRTTFVIAHRLSTVRDADRILVLDKGRLVEQGTHDELVAQGGLYARLVRAFVAA